MKIHENHPIKDTAWMEITVQLMRIHQIILTSACRISAKSVHICISDIQNTLHCAITECGICFSK